MEKGNGDTKPGEQKWNYIPNRDSNSKVTFIFMSCRSSWNTEERQVKNHSHKTTGVGSKTEK